MANHKSAEKRYRQSLKRRERNRQAHSSLRTIIKKFNTALDKGPEEARAALSAAIPVISKSASRGIIHKKNASRKISRLAKKLNTAGTGPAGG